MDRKNSQSIDFHSAEYPASLRLLKDPPRRLWYRGQWNPGLFEETLAVAGSRRITAYGRYMTSRLTAPLAAAGITIVSGFQYGVDTAAHETALESGGPTIAVMPCGIDRIYPDFQEKLYHRIPEEGGLIISEYEGETKAALWSFPKRNRIIMGLSENLLIIEAGLKSGSLNIARQAKRYNKTVWAVPGPLTSAVSRGTALLIQQGARIVTGKNDLIMHYGLSPHEAENEKRIALTEGQMALLMHLTEGPLSMDELIRAAGRPASAVGSDLTFLTLKNIVSHREGRYYAD